MLMTISRVITAVVACASSVGGSPISAMRRTPPVLAAGAGLAVGAGFVAGACASPDEAASHGAMASNAATPRARGTRCLEGRLWGSYDTADRPRPKALECRRWAGRWSLTEPRSLRP